MMHFNSRISRKQILLILFMCQHFYSYLHSVLQRDLRCSIFDIVGERACIQNKLKIEVLILMSEPNCIPHYASMGYFAPDIFIEEFCGFVVYKSCHLPLNVSYAIMIRNAVS